MLGREYVCGNCDLIFCAYRLCRAVTELVVTPLGGGEVSGVQVRRLLNMIMLSRVQPRNSWLAVVQKHNSIDPTGVLSAFTALLVAKSIPVPNNCLRPSLRYLCMDGMYNSLDPAQ